MKTFPKPLSAGEEKEYLERCKEGDLLARNMLVEHNMRLVAHVVKKYQGSDYEMEDLLSVGTIGLIKAVNTFNADKGSRLATYAARCVENAILSQMRYEMMAAVEFSADSVYNEQRKAIFTGDDPMTYKWTYRTPDSFDNMIMNSDGRYLTGLWFEGSRDVSKHVTDCEEKELPVFEETVRWLDIYFSGRDPEFTPEYKIKELTPFRQEVVNVMNTIPFGGTLMYNDISKIIARSRGIKRMSAQAVGGAVGWNPICIIIPCHRVVGAKGNLTGYGGGIKNKAALLRLEGNDMRKFFIPAKGTAL